MASSSNTRYDYVTVGHVTRDVIEDRAGAAVSRPGGSAFYSALQASRLGQRTLIVTQGVPREIEALLEPYRDELELHVIAAQHTTMLATRGAGAARSQRLLAWAGPIVAPPKLDTAILHLAPVARETAVVWDGDVGFLGITPQGLVRHWEQGGQVPLSPIELDPGALPEHFDAAVISEHECQSCRALFAAARHGGACVAVTAGARPTTVHLPTAADRSKTVDRPTVEGELKLGARASSGEGAATVVRTASPSLVKTRDDLGAGDVFAAAFFIALANGGSPLEAANFGNAAAAVRVAGVGPGAIGRRDEINAGVTP